MWMLSPHIIIKLQIGLEIVLFFEVEDFNAIVLAISTYEMLFLLKQLTYKIKS